MERKPQARPYIGLTSVGITGKKGTIGLGSVLDATSSWTNKMKEELKTEDSTKLGAIFYPTEYGGAEIPFNSLYLPWIWKEIYLDGIYTDVLNQKKDMVIMDIGSNVGLVTHHMRNYAKKIYAIEPSPENFAALKKNKEYNGWDNVELFNAAIADRDSEMVIHSLSNNRTCNSIINDYGQGGTPVKTYAFDTFMEENNIDVVDFVKCDVEGAEDMILRSEGFKKVAERVKTIEVEFHYPTWPQLVEYMIKLGYEARRYDCAAIVILFTR